MAKRMTGVERGLYGLLLIIALIVIAIGKVVDSVGWAAFVLICVGLIFVFVWLNANRRKKRVEYLRQKYKDETIVQNIMARRFWQGQTSEQLRDSLGDPASVDAKVLRNRERDVWKYYPRGANRYGLRITVENGVVVGWDQKA